VTEKDVLQALQKVRGGQRVTDQNPDDKYQALEKYGRDLVEAARQGKMDPVIGRDQEIRRVVQVLSRRTKNNPVLIGEPGVGKTAIVEGLVFVVGVLIRDALSPPDLLKGLEDVLIGDAHGTQDILGPALDLGQGEQEVLDRDVLVFHPLRLGQGHVEDTAQVGAERRFSPADLGQRVQALFDRFEDLPRIDPQLGE